ncbi:MAG: hypothetical protein METHAR1v1_590008 [Methanothrix sp.]|nr:MAG: hypothetical protein METHAR1v1_590008 [Methanothrix sp.]
MIKSPLDSYCIQANLSCEGSLVWEI